MTSTDVTPDLSLLWPPDHEIHVQPRLLDAAVSDLDLHRTITALGEEFGYATRIRDVLLQLCDDPVVIGYRQDVLADLVEIPGLGERLAALLPRVIALDSWGYSIRPGQSPLYEVVWRVGQLETYVEVIQGLQAAFEGLERPLRAEGLIRLRDRAGMVATDETFLRLVADLPELVAQVRSIASVTIGVNLDDQLRPVEATLIAINNQKFRGYASSLLRLLFGQDAPDGQFNGLTPLHSARPNGSLAEMPRGVDPDNPLLYPLFRDLADVLKKISRPVASALHHYTRVNTRLLDNLGAELAYYLGAARLMKRLQASGLPLCRPEIVPQAARVGEISGLYNVNLALRLIARDNQADLSATIVPNDALFGEAGRIFVLTGPNQGGKTTYTQAVGVAFVLAQAGLFVPGTQARISPADHIHTHFPVEERPEMETGRLGEEAQRLAQIFAQATRYSLVLLNESLASTSPGESLYLARDIVRTLRVLGARAIYATHLHELAADCDDLNAETPGDSLIASLVSLIQEGSVEGTGEITQTYRIIPGPPRGRSYARELAARYGISYEQLIALLRARGLV